MEPETQTHETEVNSPEMDRMIRLFGQLTQAGFEKVIVEFRGRDETPVISSPLFHRAQAPDMRMMEVAEAVGQIGFSAEETTEIITGLVTKSLNDRYGFWADLHGGFGTATIYPGEVGIYLQISQLRPAQSDCSLFRANIEKLYPKPRRTAAAPVAVD